MLDPEGNEFCLVSETALEARATDDRHP
jgi:hypothetical protein